MNRLEKKTTATILIAIFMISAFAVAMPVGAVLNIQALITAANPNDTVVVPADTYVQDVIIDKALTLQGAGSGVVLFTGTIRIKASDVVLDGFGITGTVYVDDSISNVIGVTISNNVITGASYGIFVGTATQNEISHLTIEDNEIVGNLGKGICFWKVDYQAGKLYDVTIRGNTISDNTGTGISTYGTGPYTIVDNIVERNAGNGISLKYDTDDYVSGNIVTDNDAMGINLHETTNALVENNVVSEHLSSDFVTTFWGGSVLVGKGSGIYIHEAGVGNTIQYNNIFGNNIGVLVNNEQGGDPVGTKINYNDVLSNIFFGIQNEAHESVDATMNWWGTDVKSEIEAKLSGLVEYDPWLNGQYSSSTVGLSGNVALEIISITVYETSVTFVEMLPGESDTQSISIRKDGNVDVSVTAGLEGETPEGFYTDNLELGGTTVALWFIDDLSSDWVPVSLILEIPPGTPPGLKTATLVFWAEEFIG